MTAEKYVSMVARQLKCSQTKRKEIKQQLLEDISSGLAENADVEQIIGRMGTPAEVAGEFNENMPAEELKNYSKMRTVKIVGIVIGVIAVLIAALVAAAFWLLPTSYQFGSSGLFQEDTVKSQLRFVVEKVDEEDYEALKNNCVSQMEKALSDDTMNKAKNQVSENWGELKEYGNIYLFEMKQQGHNYVVGQVNVIYENVAVTYTITFDKDMKLAGIYMK